MRNDKLSKELTMQTIQRLCFALEEFSMNLRSVLSRLCVLGSLSLAFSAYANQAPLYSVDGSLQFFIPVAAPSNLAQKDALQSYQTPEELSGYKVISLMKINPSPALAERLKKQADQKSDELDYSKTGITSFSKSKTAVDLGMNNVPVLDQGAYGTCVTFSTTSALDALIGQGDLIDQQCSLELDIANGGESENYWNGAYNATQIIDPLVQYGIVSKGNCLGVKYPSPGTRITLDDYAKVADKTTLKLTKETYYTDLTLDTVKSALNNGHRVLIGSIIGSLVQGFDVKVDNSKTSGGLWACKQKSSKTDYCNTQAGGHEIVVIGYDDAQQLLKIRNSWNTATGDQGDYYMTYSYFNRMIIDGTEVY
jgi:C1A family cysteine protease